MVTTLAAYDDVLQSIYDAATRPERLQKVLEKICALLASPFGNVFSWTRHPGGGGFFFSTFPAESILRYQLIQAEDPHMRAAISRGLMTLDGLVVTNQQLVPEDELLASSLYRQIWAPLDIRWMCGANVFGASDSHHLPTVLSLHRTSSQPPFNDAEVDLVRRLVAHLSRALGVMFHPRDESLQIASTRAALDQLSAGVVLLGADRHVSFANRAAKRLDNEGRLIRLAPSVAGTVLRLMRCRGSTVRKFDELVARALQPLGSDPGHFSDACVIDDDLGRVAAVVHVAPFGSSIASPFGITGEGAIVFIYDLSGTRGMSSRALAEAFELTEAEAKVAIDVLNGGTVEEAAARLGRSPNTVKAQLKSVFEKMRVDRRSDLLKLLLAFSEVRSGRRR